MENKELVNKLKNNAELAWASYGYYNLLTNDNNQLFIVLKDEKGKDRIDSNGNPTTRQISTADVMDSTFKNYEVYKQQQLLSEFKPNKIDTLKGEFTPTQAKNFFKRYDLLIHQPNTLSGFSATLFYDKKSKEFTLAIRGTE